jgi:hypothetical protein
MLDHFELMPKFHVKDTFEIPDRRLFVMAGSIVEGEIRAGMFVHIGFNPAFATTARIHSIEFARREGGEDVCLCIEADRELAEFMRDLNIGDETCEVTTDGSD